MARAWREYATGNMKNDSLAPEQKYYIQEKLAQYKRSGLDLPEEKREEIKQIQKDLAQLLLDFESNVAKDSTTVLVTKDGLDGLTDEFIKSLKRSDDGKYILALDYPTYFNVMANGSVIETRKKMYCAFKQRGYPINEKVLSEIIADLKIADEENTTNISNIKDRLNRLER